jgi:maleylacetoacetate isomerase
MKLYGYFRSSASFRVRIGLNLKGLAYENAFVHLRKGDQAKPDFLTLNPQGLVPALQDGPAVLTQSLAILEYLDETRAQPPFLPKAPADRARVRAIAQAIACDIHPLNNLRVLVYLGKVFNQPQPARDEWARHWVAEGFAAIETMLGDRRTGRFCHGDAPGLADICLVPQVFNARRVDTRLEPYPRLMKIYEACMALPAFAGADPAKQPDAEP